MLRSLHIENIAVVKRADIEPGEGFTVMTGETGAGKSVILSALSLVLGARPSADMLRAGCDTALVSALFSDISPRISQALSALGVEPDEEGTVELCRSVARDGETVKAQARINGRAVGVGALRAAATLLINIHGQLQNQRLLDPENHLGYLDSFASDASLAEAYREKYEEAAKLNAHIKRLESDSRDNAAMADMLRFQIGEIGAAKLRPGEDTELLARRQRLRSSEKVERQLRLVYRALYQNEKGLSACELLSKAGSALGSISDIIPETGAMAERLEALKSEIEDIALSAEGFSDGEDEDAEKALDDVENRLDLIGRLAKRYGGENGSCEEILAFYENAKTRLSELENASDTVEELKKQRLAVVRELEKRAEALSSARTEAAKRLSEEIVSQLRFLDMSKARFEVRVERSVGTGGRPAYLPDGADKVSFLLSANPGEPPQPLDRIASGGELARIMLAIKSVLRDKEGTDTIIYDEIDAGISGGTAQKVGIRLRDTAESCQVMCVTHSAQIASLAASHLLISKSEKDGRTETEVREIRGEDRVREIARILGGTVITDKQTEAARELLTQKL